MRDISLHILDIAENSVRAEADLIEIFIDENKTKDIVNLEIIDNGNGMTKTQLQNALDPFFTTKDIKRVGLGIPLLRANTERSGGKFSIESIPEKGTKINSAFVRSNIDRPPLGDINGTIITLILSNPELNFVYKFKTEKGEYILDTREIKKILEGVSIAESSVIGFLQKEMSEEIEKLMED